MSLPRLLLWPIVGIGVLACSPALNWRAVDGVDGGQWWLPCKPQRLEREVTLQGRRVPARFAACDAQATTWSFLAMAFPSPRDAALARDAARDALVLNLQADTVPHPPPGAVATAVPDVLWLSGRRAGGEPLTAGARFQVQGRWLVQQVLITRADATWPGVLDEAALRTFFEGALPLH